MLRNMLNFLKTIFCSSHAENNSFAILNNRYNREMELRLKRLELASLTILKRLIQLSPTIILNEVKEVKIDKKIAKFLFDSHIADDTKQPTIH